MARSLCRNQASSATLSRKLSTANGFYDDVFAGPAKVGAPTFSSRVEDYCEIFGTSHASRGSSIPFLDLPTANEREASTDVRSSRFDYSKIFSGVGDADFATPYEELFAEPKEGDITSFEEAWTPVETGSPSEGSDVLNCSEENQVYEIGNQSFDSAKQVNMSYHKANQRSDDCTNGTTHIAQLHAVPGYSLLIDELSPSIKTGGDMPIPATVNDVKLNMNFSEGMKEIKHCKTSMSHSPTCDADKQSCDGDANFQRGFDWNQSYSNDNKPNKKKNDYKKSMTQNFKASKSDAPRGGTGDCSSTSSDEEVDPNSVAAASAAAVRKAIENARARIRIARESMEKKKGGLRSGGRLSFKNGLEFREKRDSKIADAGSRFKEKVAQVVCEGVDATVQAFAEGEMGTEQVVPGFKSREKNKAAGEKHWKKSQSTQVDHGKEGVELEAVELFYDQVNTHKSGATTLLFKHADGMTTNVHKWKEEKMVKPTLEESTDIAKKMKIFEEAHKQEEIKSSIKGVQEWDASESRAASEVNGQEETVRTSEDWEETEEVKNEERLKECQQQLEGEEEEEEELDFQDCEDNEIQKRPEDTPEQEENESCEQAEDEKRVSEACEWVEYEKNEKKQKKDADMEGGNERELPKFQENEMRLNEPHDWGENEKLVKVDHQWEGNENFEESSKQEEDDTLQKEFHQMEENDKSQELTHEWEENERTQGEIDQLEENDQIKVTQEAIKCDEERNLKAADVASENDEAKNMSGMEGACMDKVNNKNVEVVEEVFSDDENGRIMEVYEADQIYEVFESRGSENELKPFKVDLEERQMFKDARLALDALKHKEIMTDINDGVKIFFLDGNGVDLGEIDMNFGQEEIDHSKEPELACRLEEQVKKPAQESGENNKHANEAKVILDKEEDKSGFESAHGEIQWTENGNKIESGCVFDGEDMHGEINQEINSSQITEGNKENLQETQTMEGSETKETLQEETKLEKERLRKMHEAKEREREIEKGKEKERIAVERAIREARERAFIEAREKAEKAAVERATAEARQRVLAEARERLDKVSAEAKSTSGKTSMEARLKAERAAVERATAEARERALEKALSGKATSEAREHAESSAADKPDPRYQGWGPSSSSRYSNSSNYGVPYATERSDRANDESTQRCKARLERHQRTVERAAKALEEKNMRDLLAQKEQAERNRLAEALDGDVKRWSSGKEGNLRALLATLQYILGPDSGWQPVSLTDIITTNAIKKAYRKATLCVHPDKLQQRGASIQQKYICEKVFDLLKDAWNKFNSEER